MSRELYDFKITKGSVTAVKKGIVFKAKYQGINVKVIIKKTRNDEDRIKLLNVIEVISLECNPKAIEKFLEDKEFGTFFAVDVRINFNGKWRSLGKAQINRAVKQD